MNFVARKTSHHIEDMRGAKKRGVRILLEEEEMKMFQERVRASHTSLYSIHFILIIIVVKIRVLGLFLETRRMMELFRKFLRNL